jgi:hypothetical protein
MLDTSRKTLTAPLAVIRINGYTSGYMRNIRVTENIQRAEVKGISSTTVQEVPVVGYTCSLSADFFMISLERPELLALVKRDTGTLNDFINTLLLGEIPIQIQIFKKKKVTEVGGIVTEVDNEGQIIATIQDFYPDSQNFDITENQVSGTNISGRYLTPVLFSKQ